ncbi:hypothetical protein ONS96_000562 [Cadophora gregata f. sp. sojae]|nr:hypothetical protein ONS96_000562 [Cadophora gregata f. sp. sojae]
MNFNLSKGQGRGGSSCAGWKARRRLVEPISLGLSPSCTILGRIKKKSNAEIEMEQEQKHAYLSIFRLELWRDMKACTNALHSPLCTCPYIVQYEVSRDMSLLILFKF